jgi:hypothetical protein
VFTGNLFEEGAAALFYGQMLIIMWLILPVVHQIVDLRYRCCEEVFIKLIIYQRGAYKHAINH